MEFSELPLSPLLILQILLLLRPTQSASNLFREYIGAEFKKVTFSDLPINSDVECHFIVSFAIDYTNSSSSPSPTNGKFNIFWDKDNLGPSHVSAIKSKHSNVKVAVSIGGDSVGNGNATFSLSSPSSWISNAVSSLTNILQEYNLDGTHVLIQIISIDH